MKIFLLSVTLLVCFITANSQTGNPDPSFGNNGIVSTDFGANVSLSTNLGSKVLLLNDGSFYLVVSSNSSPYSSYVTHRFADGSLDVSYGINGYSPMLDIYAATGALQVDGKIIVAGNGFLSGPADFVLARLKTNGTLDSSFSGDGIVTTNFPGPFGDGWDELSAIALQNDGKIIAGGSSSSRFALARYLSDGALDNSFANSGLFLTDLGADRSLANGITVQADGKIIAIGQRLRNDTNRTVTARLLPNGSWDNSFSVDGLKVFNSSIWIIGGVVQVQLDSKILIGGSLTTGNNSQFGIVRLLTNGDLDNSFSGDGLQSVNFGLNSGSISDMALQPDGKIVIGGLIWQAGDNTDLGIARVNTDGSLDNSFSNDGITITTIGTSADYLSSIALEPDGKILVGGSSFFSPTFQFAVLRYKADGTLDNSFDGDGILLGFKPSFATAFNASAVQPDGKLVVVGYAWARAWWTETPEQEIAAVRYNTDGTLDHSFSEDGKLIIDYGTGAGNGTSVLIQEDGRIVIGGTVSIGSYNDFAMIRLNPDGSFDNSFSGDGKLLTDFGNTEDQCLSIAIQKDGKIVAAGYSIEYGTQRGQDIAIARYNIDGSLDNSFSGDGKLVSDFIGAEGFSTTNTADKVLIQDDGKIVVTGQYAFWTAHIDFMAVRYLPDGALDPSFNGIGIVTTDIGGMVDQARTSALQADGKIVVAGLGYSGFGSFAAVRYNINGTLDSGFSIDGILTENTNEPTAMAIQTDGKLIFGGTSDNHLFLYRYNSDGALDNTFGANGKAVEDLGGRVSGLSISGNRIYAVGRIDGDGTTGFVAAYQLGCSINATIPDAMAFPIGVDPNTVYIGYAPASSIVLKAYTTHAPRGQTYLWSTGVTTSSIRVSPTIETTYSVTITNEQGCSGTRSKLIKVRDIRCGNKLDKVEVCQDSKWDSRHSKTICISAYVVSAFLYSGSYLGACRDDVITRASSTKFDLEENTAENAMEIRPNPTNSEFAAVAKSVSKEKITLNIYDASGRMIERKQIGANEMIVFGSTYRPGIYYAEVLIGNLRSRIKLIKQ